MTGMDERLTMDECEALLRSAAVEPVTVDQMTRVAAAVERILAARTAALRAERDEAVAKVAAVRELETRRFGRSLWVRLSDIRAAIGEAG